MEKAKPTSLAGQSGKKRYVISQRQPWELPTDEVDLPAPGAPIGEPPAFNLLTAILPPVLMIGGTLIFSLVSGSGNMKMMIPMMIMSMGFPLATSVGLVVQRKDYKKKIVARETNYRQKLKTAADHLKELAKEQRQTLEGESPALPKLTRIALEQGNHPRLWCRRPYDSDFLSLRIGKGPGAPSFTVNPPKLMDSTETLGPLAAEAAEGWKQIPDLPALVDLRTVGSLAIAGRSSETTYPVAQRMLLDLIVHHSPDDVQVALLSDARDAQRQWQWLKWAPHTQALNEDVSPRKLAFDEPAIEQCLRWLSDEFHERQPVREDAEQKRGNRPVIVAFLDDHGIARSTPDIARIADTGHECGICLVFVGGRNWPRECRARLDVLENDAFRYLETWSGEGGGAKKMGTLEPVSLADCERVVRPLAGLELIGSQTGASLPDSIRVSQVLGLSHLTVDVVRQKWERETGPRDLLQFPVGVHVGRAGLEPMAVDLRPEDLGGKQAFHTVLIGTTGSGKSVFLQSLVLTAACQYSPKQLNFLLMDFKAGASELSKLKELPHVVGLVTDLSPEMAARALVALESEIQRRKQVFEKAGKISDIWAYNRRYPDQYMPHLLLVLDEFAKGVEILPDLQKVLQTLATQGRALGMYLLLANQRVTSAVDQLLSNIGWRIVLRVSEREEMRIVDPTRPPTTRPGRGYIRVKEEVQEFQGSRSDQAAIEPSQEKVEEYKILRIEADGRKDLLFSHAAESRPSAEGQSPHLSELDTLIQLMRQATQELGYAPARPIYLNPLPAAIQLDEVLQESGIPLLFSESGWQTDRTAAKKLAVPIGMLDHPEECIQDCLVADFDRLDGHLWIVGAPGSGKAMVLTTLLTALAKTHTPEEVQFFILEYGAGTLRPFDRLPHTGAVIRLPEQERLERLLNYLDAEMDRRTAEAGGSEGQGRRPALFLIINNYAEMRTNYPELADRISRYVRDGKAAGMHLIIATNRGIELARMVSSSIAQRLILQLASRDEYMDLIGRLVPPLSQQGDGRGYWIQDGVAEGQVARSEAPAGVDRDDWMSRMATTWQGDKPRSIVTLNSSIPMADVLKKAAASPSSSEGVRIPIGVSYENLGVLTPNFLEEIPDWLVLGPRQSGKSNFLGCVAAGACANPATESWEIKAYLFRRSPLSEVGAAYPRLRILSSPEEILQDLQQFQEVLSTPENHGPGSKYYLILMDDLGAVFEPGRENLAAALNAVATKSGTRTDVIIVGAGLLDELRNQIGTPIIRLLRQSRTGIAFSKDSNELDWLGTTVPLGYRKLDFPPGRGFWVSHGKAQLVQSPWAERPRTASGTAGTQGSA